MGGRSSPVLSSGSGNSGEGSESTTFSVFFSLFWFLLTLLTDRRMFADTLDVPDALVLFEVVLFDVPKTLALLVFVLSDVFFSMALREVDMVLFDLLRLLVSCSLKYLLLTSFMLRLAENVLRSLFLVVLFIAVDLEPVLFKPFSSNV